VSDETDRAAHADPAAPAGTAGRDGALQAATAALASWLATVTGASVRVGTPTDGSVALWPYDLRAARQTTGTGARHPYRFTVRYVVAADLPALDRVLAEAVRTGEPTISLDGLDPAVWSALGVPPRPVLLVEVPATIVHAVPDVPLVRAPLTLRHADLQPLDGAVLGPDDQPLAEVRVGVSGTAIVTYTDSAGRFRLAGVPGPGHVCLRIEGRGRAFTADVDLPSTEPVVIRCAFEHH
jgi:hypothetical protein